MMTKKNVIRVPRTTARFVAGLSRILREQLELNVTEHEHWTFEHVASYELCGAPETCSRHGGSQAYEHWFDEAPRHLDPYDYWSSWCYEYDINTYVGVGQAEVSGEKVELRVHLEQTHSDVMGDLYIARVWMQDQQGKITKGEYGLFDDGRPYYENDSEMPDYPPNRIAFWRDEEKVAEEAAA